MKKASEEKDFGLHNLWVYFQMKPISIWILIGLIGLGTVLLTSGNQREEYSKENFDQIRVAAETSSSNSESAGNVSPISVNG